MKKDNPQLVKRVAELLLTHSDTEIGLEVGLTKDQVRNVRKRNGLDRNFFKEQLLKSGFDGDSWSHGWLKTDNASIFIKNGNGFISYEELRDELVAEMRKYAPKYPKIPRVKDKHGHVLVIDPADVHFGKLAVKSETGEDYDLEVATKRFRDGITELVSKAEAYNVAQIVLVLGNDILHIDTPKRTTTAGTPQDTDGIWYEAYQTAKRCYVDAIEKLLTIADVHLVFCPSNHDFMSGYMLADSVTSWFAKSKNVTFDVSLQHRKYLRYGLNLIGFTHGDGARNNDLHSHMANEAKEAWGISEFRYWYVHHLHHKDRKSLVAGEKRPVQNEKDTIGLTTIKTGLKLQPKSTVYVEVLRSPSAPDRWHFTNGYTNLQAVEAFIHHPLAGQVARFTHYF